MKWLLLIGVSLLGACASNSGVVPIGQDTFMVSRQAATGFSGMGDLKAQAFREANAHCESMKKSFQVVATSDSQPPYVLGNFPRTEVQFMCLDKGDSQLGRPRLEQTPNTVIQIKQ